MKLSRESEGVATGLTKRVFVTSVIIITAILYFIELSYGVGWLYGLLFFYLRREWRQLYLNYVSRQKKFNLVLYTIYTLISFAFVIGSISFAFTMEEWINPVPILVAYIVEYIFMVSFRFRGNKIKN